MKILKTLLSTLLILAMLASFASCDSKSKKRNSDDDDDDNSSQESSEISTNESSESEISDDISNESSNTVSDDISNNTSSETSNNPMDETPQLNGTIIYEDGNVAISYVDVDVVDGSVVVQVNVFNKTNEKIVLSTDGFAINGWSETSLDSIEIYAFSFAEDYLDLYKFQDIASRDDIATISVAFSVYKDIDYETIATIPPVTFTVNPNANFESYTPKGTIILNEDGITVSAETVEYEDGYLDVYFYVENNSDKYIVVTDNSSGVVNLDGKDIIALFGMSAMPKSKALNTMTFFALEEEGITSMPSTLSFTMEIYDAYNYETLYSVPVVLNLQ